MERLEVRPIENDYSFYTPLDVGRNEIRLLALYPRTKWPELTCGIITQTLESAANEYQCLSYCWGDVQETTTIRLKHTLRSAAEEMENYQTDTSGVRFRITTNLEHALLRMRDEEFFVMMWVDSISINQADPVERSSQVSLMRDIFSSAYRVAIWLGDEEESTVEAFIAIRDIGKSFESATGVRAHEFVDPQGIAFPLERLAKVFDQRTDIDPQIAESRRTVYHALARLFDRPWFSRVWVLQEVHASEEAGVYCGRLFAPWGSLLLAHFWHKEVGILYLDEKPYMDGSTNPIEKPWKSLPSIWESISTWGKTRRLPISLLVERVREFLATDQRDYIYALLGIAEETADLDSLSPLMKPDYNKPTYQVYADYTRALIESQGSLSMLSLIDFRSPSRLLLREVGLPTWSVSFNGGPDPDSVLTVWDDSDASAAMPLTIRETSDPSSLCLAGIRVDKIASISNGVPIPEPGEMTALDGLKASEEAVFRFIANTCSDPTPYPNGEDKLTACIRTVTANHYPRPKGMTPERPKDEENPPWHSIFSDAMLADFAAYWNRLDNGLTALQPKYREKLLPLIEQGDAEDWIEQISRHNFGRCYFRTADGYTGLGPSGLHLGDHVVILYGGKTPFILRTGEGFQDSTGSSAFVMDFLRPDECYVIHPDPFEVGSGSGIATREKDAQMPWFEFVGECYVHGFMEGEAFAPENEGKFQTYDFKLR